MNREEFGISYGKQLGFNMDVNLKIAVEDVKSEATAECDGNQCARSQRRARLAT